MSLFDRWRRWSSAGWGQPPTPRVPSAAAATGGGPDPPRPEFRPAPCHPVLVIVEGRHDAEFLRRISTRLHAADPSLPNLPLLEGRGAILFLYSGGDAHAWATRLAPLGRPEFHLLDAEEPPESAYRHEAAAQVNARPRCRAFVTRKRSVENYLHPDAIREARGIAVEFDDRDCVPELVARRLFESSHTGVTWDALPYRVQRRLRDRAKRWLNTDAVDRMTVARLQVRDPRPGRPDSGRAGEAVCRDPARPAGPRAAR